MIGHIYLISRISDKSPCYIGQHVIGDREYITSSKILIKLYNKYGLEWFWEKYKKEIIIDNIFAKEKLNQLEIECIVKYNTYKKNNKRGYNLTTGGNGGDLGYIVNSKISKTLKNKKKIECIYCKQVFSIACINRNHNENCLKNPNLTENKLIEILNFRKEMSKIKLGVNNPNYNPNISNFKRERNIEYRERKKLKDAGVLFCSIKKPKINIFVKSVIQMDLEGNILNTYKSAREALKFLNLKCASQISWCCKGNRKTAYGFKWKFLDNEIK